MTRLLAAAVAGLFLLSGATTAQDDPKPVVAVAAVTAAKAEQPASDPPPDLTGPDQRVPRALGAASFFPVRGMPKGAQSDLFMVPADVGEFFALYDRDGNPVGVFSCDKPGQYSCVLVWLIDGKLGRDVHTITVGSVPPVPPDPKPPGPIPPEPVPVPDGKLGFTKLAFTEGSKVSAPARQKAGSLADNFSGVASAIAAGAMTTVEQANAEMARKNREVLSVQADRDGWLPFLQAWAKAADSALQAGTLKATASDYAEIYNATADGLRRVK